MCFFEKNDERRVTINDNYVSLYHLVYFNIPIIIMKKSFLLLAFAAIGLSAFAQKSKSEFVGKWVLDDLSIMTYKKDGSCTSVSHSKQIVQGVEYIMSISLPGVWKHEGDSLYVDMDEKKANVSIALSDPNSVDITKRQAIESQLRKLADPIKEKVRASEIAEMVYFVKDVNDNSFDIVNKDSGALCHGMKK